LDDAAGRNSSPPERLFATLRQRYRGPASGPGAPRAKKSRSLRLEVMAAGGTSIGWYRTL
jgi:hypothetical protein